MADVKCVVCDYDATAVPVTIGYDHAYKVQCKRCGIYTIDSDASRDLESAWSLDKKQMKVYIEKGNSSKYIDLEALLIEVSKKAIQDDLVGVRSIISYVLRKNTDTRFVVNTSVLTNIVRNNELLTIAEQSDAFIVFLANEIKSPGIHYPIYGQNYTTIEGQNHILFLAGLFGMRIGSEFSALNFMILSQENSGYLELKKGLDTNQSEVVPQMATLTFAGWQKFYDLKVSNPHSRLAFIAMEFADSTKTEKDYFFQNELLEKYLVPAVKQTGFDLLNPLSRDPKAGNIHARLEVEIRSARFVIAELSHHNNGAYWEAGFARGLDKPVIYMFNKSADALKPHFDVGSDHIVFWDKDKPEEAADALKAVIRATLYGEAIMRDES